MNGADVRAAARIFTGALAPHVDRDWSALSIAGLDHTVASIAAHVAETCTWYALDLAAGGRQIEVVRPTGDAAATPSDLLASVEATATVLARVVDGADPSDRGYHPHGRADPAGFAAMGCDELLIHADDASRGLGVALEAPSGLAERVLARLFPGAVPGPGEDAWSLLRWCNDRLELPGRGRVGTGWRWQAAPQPYVPATGGASPSQPVVEVGFDAG